MGYIFFTGFDLIRLYSPMGFGRVILFMGFDLIGLYSPIVIAGQQDNIGENPTVILCVCVMCVVIPFVLDVRLVDAPAGVT